MLTPAVLTTDFGGAANVVLVGTRDSVNPSRFFSLRLADGVIISSFDNSPNGFGIVSSLANVVYPNRVIFTTHSFGANPGGIPLAMPKNWNRNCPVKSASPIATSAGHAIGGRATNATGIPAIRNRNAVSCGGEKLSRPIRVVMKPNPQMTATRTARARSRDVNVGCHGAPW